MVSKGGQALCLRRESVKDEDPDDVASPPLLMAFDLPYPEVPERLAATRSVAKSRNQRIVDRAPLLLTQPRPAREVVSRLRWK
jgi:hypothetical protein